ncbi:hypothetical protein LFYK43_04680 [Ligilactobacillus salitolerans]|uniref:Glycosyltransferase RgtA/B/C/D-like domain-containing protein n=1 Tax=Ligilactobacillus salitolerans TaxID=1808352 RepID=A0A401IR35_9LACO|nr:hypothetical protein [Ligilactobacillus salitolerans]GBG94009.1 hypothetical protein LFYK43_04680 [Ligilactobacillus salitolerans]
MNSRALLLIKRVLLVLMAVYMIIGICANLYDHYFSLKTVILVPLAVIGPLFLKVLYAYLGRFSDKNLRIFTWAAFAGMIVLQIYVLLALPATVYHDAFRIVQQAEQIGTGDIDWTSTYFLRNPNNVPLAAMLGDWFKLTNFLGLSPNIALIILKLAIFDGMLAVVLAIFQEATGKRQLPASGALFFLVSPYSYTYNIQVFYTDTPIFFAISLVALVLLKQHHKSLHHPIIWLTGLFITCLAAQVLKPNFVIIAAAAGLTMLGLLLWKKAEFKHLLGPFLVVVCAIGLAFPAGKLVNASVSYHPDSSYELPTLHWTQMGLNVKNYGMYSGSDTKQTLKIPSLKERNATTKKIIVQRVKKLGFFGLLKLWTVKAGILLSVNNYNQAYTGGFIQSPAWFQQHQRWWTTGADLMLRCAFIFLYAQTLLTLAGEFKRRQSSGLVLFLLLAMIGYLTAHTLFWEVEERYGQAIFPLLLTLNAHYLAQGVPSVKFAGRKLAGLSALILVLGGGYLGLNRAKIVRRPVVTVAQRSQLSDQYHARVVWIEPGESVTQNVWVNSSNNYFAFLHAPGSQIKVTLTDIDAHQTFDASSGKLKFRTNRIKPGKYQIKLDNETKERQPAWLVRTHKYLLGQESANISEPNWGKRTLIYLFGQTRSDKIK